MSKLTSFFERPLGLSTSNTSEDLKPPKSKSLKLGSNRDSIANASCERGFSTMKRVKSDWHCALGTNTMDMLMRVKIEGPRKQADYRPRAAVDRCGGCQDNDKGDQIFNTYFFLTIQLINRLCKITILIFMSDMVIDISKGKNLLVVSQVCWWKKILLAKLCKSTKKLTSSPEV